ncbi:MAG: capsule biosynthesis protein [Nitrospira sp.]|nr:capsule biosynthesis protein [Nitrospira sp.]
MRIPCAEIYLAGCAVKILFFAPHAAIWVHAFPEALIAETLAQSGHTIVYVSCGEALQQVCIPMNAFGLDHLSPVDARRKICRLCGEQKELLRREFGFAGCDLADLLEPADRIHAQEMLDALSFEECMALTIENVPVGTLALYETILNRKKTGIEFDASEQTEYRAWLRGAVTTVIAGKRLFEREQPDCIAVYNSFYSVNHVMCRLASAHGVPHYFLHAGGNLSRRLQTLMVGREEAYRYLRSLVDRWPQYRDLPCAPGVLREITNHFLVLFGGRSVFSYSSGASREPFDVRKRFGIRMDQKIMVATMSSNDERVAAKAIGILEDHPKTLFSHQVDWVKRLIEFVDGRADLFLLIRVHPRDFPNKREAVKSEQARNLETMFRQLPNNVRVNWPNDEVSLYDLANETAVFLNAWSSAGKEMSLLGLPVVIYAPALIYYPSEFNYVGETEQEFVRKIDQALRDGWSLDRCRATYRWLAVEYGYGLIDIGDSYPPKDAHARSVLHRVMTRVERLVAPLHQQRQDCKRRADRLRASQVVDSIFRSGAATPADPNVWMPAPEVSREEEDRVLRSELVRIGKALFGSGSIHRDGTLAARLEALS